LISFRTPSLPIASASAHVVESSPTAATAGPTAEVAIATPPPAVAVPDLAQEAPPSPPPSPKRMPRPKLRGVSATSEALALAPASELPVSASAAAPQPASAAASPLVATAAKKAEAIPVGWLPEGSRCGTCSKSVLEFGGVFCGRRRPSGRVAGCGAGVCWRCMNKGPKESFGKVRTTKTEFSSLGADAWWMHEACMSKADKRDYYEKEDEGEGGEDHFAWE